MSSAPNDNGVPSATSITYRADIDGLRAVAVSTVVLCHAGLGLPGGYVGVDVFFVISGFLITSLILKELENHEFSLARFWERRVRRILPALATVTIATAVAGVWLLLPDAAAALGTSIVSLALLGSNIHFWSETGYFEEQATEKPLLHTWSLAVEEQFYILIPLFLSVVAHRNRLRAGFVIIAVAASASFALSIRSVDTGSTASAFYLMPARAWELFAGALVARWSGSLHCRWRFGREVAAASGLVCILLPCFLYDEKTHFPGLAALPPVAGAVLLIASGGAFKPIPYVSRILAWRPVVALGLISYSLYLWHWPLFAFANYSSVSDLTTTRRVWLVGASLALATVTWWLVERPFRSRRLLVTRPQLLRATGLVFVILFASGATLHSGLLSDLRWSSIELAELFTATGQRDPRYFNELSVEDVPKRLVHVGNTDVPAAILIWGDSHAMAILPAVESACRDGGISAVAATHSSTPPVIGHKFKHYGQNGHSVRFNAAVMNYVRSRPVRAVILVGYWQAYDKAEGPGLADALLKTVDELHDSGLTVYFMNTVPVFDLDVPRVLALQISRGSRVPRLSMTPSEYDANNPFQSRLVPLLRQRGVRILDPAAVFQTRSGSSQIVPFDARGSFYVDGQHLSTHGALALKPMVEPVVEAVLAESRQTRRSSFAGEGL